LQKPARRQRVGTVEDTNIMVNWKGRPSRNADQPLDNDKDKKSSWGLFRNAGQGIVAKN
jgi:hypothetical protein